MLNLPKNAKWSVDGKTVAGGNRYGNADNQLNYPWGLDIDDDNQSIVIADCDNHRIVEWKMDPSNGKVIAGGRGPEDRLDQLKFPTDVRIDKETNSLFIADRGNRRVVRWSRCEGTTQGKVIVDNIACYGLAIDHQRYLYVSDTEENEVRRYTIGDMNGIVVAGGNERGNQLNQLNWPTYLFVDEEQALYVSDHNNHRVVKWNKDANQGIVVAGGQEERSALTQLFYPQELFVDTSGTIYGAEGGNDRVMRWPKGAQQGSVIVGGNGGNAANQLNEPKALSFDRHGNLYVVDEFNDRVQSFYIQSTSLQDGKTVAGGNRYGNVDNQLNCPCGLDIDDDNQSIVIADCDNHRIVEWKMDPSNGKVIAGGRGPEDRLDQLKFPTDVRIDKETNSLFIADRGNRRVVRWSRCEGTTQGKVIVDNIACYGLAIDHQRYLYVSDTEENEVRRYTIGDMNGIVVAGGNERGNQLNQLNWPTYLFVDEEQALYVSDHLNHRVMKWDKDANQGIVVAGGRGGTASTQLYYPRGLFVDTLGTIYVADSSNNRIMRWRKRAQKSTVIVDGNKENRENQLNMPAALSFDLRRNLYVIDCFNHRVQRFDIQ